MSNAINSWIFSLGFPADMLMIAGVALLLSALALFLRRVSLGGAAVLFILLFSGGWFFRSEGLLVAALTFIIGEVKKRSGAANLPRMLGKYVVPITSAGLWFLFGRESVFEIVFLASLAEVAADSAGSNIGFLSADLPVSPSTRLPIKKGEPGGISVLGILASLFAAALVSLFFLGSGRVNIAEAGIAFVSAFAGTFVDSWLGASVEAYGERGVPWLDNSLVDFMGSLAAAALATGLSALFL